jgi:hypothetical protein
VSLISVSVGPVLHDELGLCLGVIQEKLNLKMPFHDVIFRINSGERGDRCRVHGFLMVVSRSRTRFTLLGGSHIR